jgi:hypothetical protein
LSARGGRVGSRWIRHSLGLTLDALDLLGTKAGDGPLVLGARDASRPDGALDVDEGGAHGRTALAAERGTTLDAPGRQFGGR